MKQIKPHGPRLTLSPPSFSFPPRIGLVSSFAGEATGHKFLGNSSDYGRLVEVCPECLLSHLGSSVLP